MPLQFDTRDSAGSASIDHPAQPQAAADRTRAPAYTHVARDIGARWHLIENYLPDEDLQKLIGFVSTAENSFEEAKVTNNKADARKGIVRYGFEPWKSYFMSRIGATVKPLLGKLALPDFTVGEIECQLSAYFDGGYYGPHIDNGGSTTTARKVSFVYYFNTEPRAFSGGHLRIYDSMYVLGKSIADGMALDLAPVNNSLIFFPSECLHEVTPVVMASMELQKARLTINGWLRP